MIDRLRSLIARFPLKALLHALERRADSLFWRLLNSIESAPILMIFVIVVALVALTVHATAVLVQGLVFVALAAFHLAGAPFRFFRRR